MGHQDGATFNKYPTDQPQSAVVRLRENGMDRLQDELREKNLILAFVHLIWSQSPVGSRYSRVIILEHTYKKPAHDAKLCSRVEVE